MQILAIDISGSVYAGTFSTGYFLFIKEKYQELLAKNEPLKVLLWARECHAFEIPEDFGFEPSFFSKHTHSYNSATHPSTIFENEEFKLSLEEKGDDLTVTFITDGQVNEHERVGALSTFVRDFSDRKIGHTDIVVVTSPFTQKSAYVGISNIFKLVSNSATETIYKNSNNELSKIRQISLSKKAIQVINASNQIELASAENSAGSTDSPQGNTDVQKLIDGLVAELSEEEVTDLGVALKDLKKSTTVYVDDTGRSISPTASYLQCVPIIPSTTSNILGVHGDGLMRSIGARFFPKGH